MMKLERSKAWYEARIAAEGETEVDAGSPPWGQPGNALSRKKPSREVRMAFGTLVELWRRNKNWNAGKLAKEAGLKLEAILDIEHHCGEPEPTSVKKLAKVFGLPAAPLMELAGVAEPRTPLLREAATRFAARAESTAALNANEREALEALVSAIAAAPTAEV